MLVVLVMTIRCNDEKEKKKTLIDARSKSYKQHRKKLEKARERREETKK